MEPVVKGAAAARRAPARSSAMEARMIGFFLKKAQGDGGIPSLATGIWFFFSTKKNHPAVEVPASFPKPDRPLGAPLFQRALAGAACCHYATLAPPRGQRRTLRDPPPPRPPVSLVSEFARPVKEERFSNRGAARGPATRARRPGLTIK